MKRYYYCYITDNEMYWVYDRYSNQIAQVDLDTYNLFDTYDSHKFDENKIKYFFNQSPNLSNIIKVAKNVREHIKNKIAFVPFEIEKSEMQISSDKLHDKYSNEIKHIILNLTEDCNLRCKYCVFGDLSYRRSRHHNSTTMDDSTIKQSIEFIKNVIIGEELIIGFYGGEPLLAIDKIKLIVKKTNNITNTVRFGITTNGVLLNNNIIDFFVKNNFYLKISIDGPKSIHDRNRV